MNGGNPPGDLSMTAKFEITVSEVEMRRNSAGRMLKARLYQPKGLGPFPTVLDLHGGAWNAKDRTAEEPMDRLLYGFSGQGGEGGPGGGCRVPCSRPAYVAG
jgi:hypothetical protein